MKRTSPRSHHPILAAGAAAVLVAALSGCGDDDGATPDGGAEADAAVSAGADAAVAARDLITLPGDAVYPEGIAAAADGTLYVGSIGDGVILRVAPGAGEPDGAPFVANGVNGLVSAVGLLLDEPRGLLWACSSDPGAAPNTGSAPPGLKAFDLDTGAAAGSYDMPGGGLCNDLAIDDDGAVYLTDSLGPRILRLAPGADELETWLEDDAFSGDGFNLNGIAVSGDVLYAVKYNDGALFRVDIASDGAAGALVAIPVEPALEAPDGLKVVDGHLLVVEGVGRLTRVTIGGNGATGLAVEDGLDGPTTFAIVGGDAWVVEGQLGNLFDPSTGDPDLPFKVVRVPLE